MELKWIEGVVAEGVEMNERLKTGERVGYTDGSRMEGVAAAATAEGAISLGRSRR